MESGEFYDGEVWVWMMGQDQYINFRHTEFEMFSEPRVKIEKEVRHRSQQYEREV